MDSIQQVFVHQTRTTTSPLLIINTSALALVTLLSVSIVVTLSNWCFQRHHYHHPLAGYYEDEDGVAIDGPKARNANRIPTAIHLLAVVINALLFLAKICVFPLSNHTTEAWLQFAIAVLLVLQGSALYAPVPPTVRYRFGLCSGASCFVAVATQCVQFYFDSRHPINHLQPWLVILAGTQLTLTVIAGSCALLLQRRPDVFHNDAVVDRKNTVSLLGRLSFSWAIPLLRASKHEDLDVHDLPELDQNTRAESLFYTFTKAQEDQKSPRLWWTILRSHGSTLVIQLMLSLVSCLLAFVPRLALLGILKALDNSTWRSPREDNPQLWLYVAVLGASSVVANIVTTWKFWVSINVISTRVYAQLTCTIYHKFMRLNGDGGSNNNNGEDDPHADTNQHVVNAMASEAKGIANFVGESYQLLETPVRLVCCGALLLWLLGWQSMLAGILVIVLSGPAQGYVVKKAMSATRAMLGRRDERMSILSELISGIRQVKFLVAEKEWEERVNEARDREVHAASRTILSNVLLSSWYLTQPILLAVVMLSVYSFTQPRLSAATAFTSITILNLVEQALDTLPVLQMRLVNVFLFSRRIENYLQQPERTPYIIPSDHIELEDAAIAWPSCRPTSDGMPTGAGILWNINLQFPHGKLSVVSGHTGAGKSLLLSSLIGECELIAGVVRAPTAKQAAYSPRVVAGRWLVDDAVAYVAQTAWIETGTIRDNILFGCPYLPQRYSEVLFACALNPDLEMLSDGDMTEVGGNGVNLSGGQKSRLSLARAIYSRAQTLIMDDIFSAVDVHTAKHLYEHALTGPLVEGRTCVLATYQVELCLSRADYLVTLDGKGGCHGATVTKSQRDEAVNFEPEDGMGSTYDTDDCDSRSISITESSRTMQTVHSTPWRFSEMNTFDDTASIHRPFVSASAGGQVGSVRWKTIRDFSRYSGGIYHWVFLFILCVTYGVLSLGRGYAIKLWTSRSVNTETADYSSQQYLLLYIGISGAAIVVGTVRIYVTLSSSLRGSAAIFRRLLYNVLRARLRWLDTTPIGNLLSRFSADCAVVDLQIGNSLKQLLFFAVSILTAVASGAIEAPRLIIYGVFLMGICFWCARDYVAASRQLKRLESSAMGPIFDHLSSSAAGISTIRAFGRDDSYVKGFLEKVDLYSRSFWHVWLLNRWMGFWMNIVGAVFSTVTAMSMVSIPHIDAAAAGLAISFTMQLGDYLVNAVQAYAAFEMDMNSVHRLLEYTDIELEGDDKGTTEPSAAWPTRGQLQVSNLVARYSPELPPVLRDITFDADANQRIGVVGRTGAGKSSLSLALMRFLDVEGDVTIDGVNLSRVPLHRLRKAIHLIPQSPVLFSGTVRYNLDPLGQYDDTDILSALEGVHWIRSEPSDASPVAESTTVGSSRYLDVDAESTRDGASSTISTLVSEANPTFPTKAMLSSNMLQRQVAEGGSNLSLGERQLLCLARAILNKPKMLILDESTSSVDHLTDERIQQSIRSEFRQSSTLLVIAHRLRTIADFDRILVLDHGEVAEFGTPSRLMTIEGGVFRSLVEGDAERSVLEQVIRLSSERVNT